MVYYKPIALNLGLKPQLVLIGFLLSVQGFCVSRQIILCAIFCQVRFGRSTLQNLESILRKAPYDRSISLPVRVTLLSLTGLPLLLSVLYKQFIFGTTSQTRSGIDGQFGIIPPPSLSNLTGNGIALAVNAMTPYWRERLQHHTYGENMFAINQTTTFMLDTPYPSLYKDLRQFLGEHDTFLLEATVNATVSNDVEMSSQQREDFGKTFDDVYNPVEPFKYWRAGIGDGWWAGMVVGGVNSSYVPAGSAAVNYIGIWHEGKGFPENELFSKVVHKLVLSRQRVRGVWHISRSAINLISATPEQEDPGNFDAEIQKLLQFTQEIDLLGQVLLEYNYRWWFRQEDHEKLNPVTTFMATILWARVAAKTMEDVQHKRPWYPQVNYTKSGQEYTLQFRTPTMSQSPLLLLIFVVNPLLVIIATIIKATLHRIPVTDGFGLTSLLSGASSSNLELLRGAALSGQLKGEVRVNFEVEGAEGNEEQEQQEEKTAKLSVHFNRQNRSSLLTSGVKYE